jgi:hypothetical protein
LGGDGVDGLLFGARGDDFFPEGIQKNEADFGGASPEVKWCVAGDDWLAYVFLGGGVVSRQHRKV